MVGHTQSYLWYLTTSVNAHKSGMVRRSQKYRFFGGGWSKNELCEACSPIQQEIVQNCPHPPLISAILQLNKLDFCPISHKIKLKRKFTLKSQHPHVSKKAATSNSVHDLCIGGYAHYPGFYVTVKECVWWFPKARHIWTPPTSYSHPHHCKGISVHWSLPLY